MCLILDDICHVRAALRARARRWTLRVCVTPLMKRGPARYASFQWSDGAIADTDEPFSSTLFMRTSISLYICPHTLTRSLARFICLNCYSLYFPKFFLCFFFLCFSFWILFIYFSSLLIFFACFALTFSLFFIFVLIVILYICFSFLFFFACFSCISI